MRIDVIRRLFQRDPLNLKDITVGAFSNDTRSMSCGDIFVAIRTPANDGHKYLETARRQGANGYVLSRLPDDPDLYINMFLTRDPVRLIGDGASRLLQNHARVRIGVTGSAGKTTTKELIALLATGIGSVGASEGNFNNTIGLPLTVLNRLDHPVDTYVTEMGMSYPGEIARLVEIVQPDIRIWLNVMPAHIGNFPSLEALRDAKAEILSNRTSDTVVIYNADDVLVKSRVESEPGVRFSFGFHPQADLRILEVNDQSLERSRMRVRFRDEDAWIEHSLPGRHHAANIAAAILTARIQGVPMDRAPELLATFTPINGRGRLLKMGPVTVYDDCYNANPEAVKLVLNLLNSVPVAGRRVAVLGDMLELGDASESRHREIGVHLNSLHLDFVVFFGPRMKAAHLVYSGPSLYVDTTMDAAEAVPGLLKSRDTVLVKASRGLHGEQVIQAIQQELAS